MPYIYYISSNNGDGSSSVHFYDSQECIEELKKHDLEGYGSSDDGWFCVESLEHIWSIDIETIEDVNDYLMDMGFIEDTRDD